MSKILKYVIAPLVIAAVLAVVVFRYRLEYNLKQQLVKAESSLAAGQFVDAARISEQILRTHPDESKAVEIYLRAMYAAGKQLENPDYFRNVIRLYEMRGETLILDSGKEGRIPPVELLVMKGISHLELEEIDQAYNVLSRAVQMNVNSLDAYIGLMRIQLIRAGLDYTAPRTGFRSVFPIKEDLLHVASENLERAKRISPGNKEVRFYTGILAWFRGGSQVEKNLIFDEAEGGTTDMRLIAALARLSQRRTADAQRLLDKVQSTVKNSQRAMLNSALATQKYLAGNLDDAQRDMSFARRNDQEMWWFPNLRLDLAAIESARGNYLEAISFLERLKDRSQGNEERADLLLLLMLNSDRRGDAGGKFHREANLLEDKSSGLLLYMATRTANPEELSGLYARVLEEDPGNVIANYNLGTLRLQERATRAAQDLFQKALQTMPGFLDAQVNLAIALYWRAQEEQDPSTAETLTREAVSRFESILEEHPNLPEALIGLGLIHTDGGNLTEAEAFLARVPESGSNGANAQLLLARIYQLRGDLPKAISAASRALELNPGSDWGAVKLGNLYLRVGDPRTAITYFDIVLAIPRSLTYPDAVNGKAIALYLQERFTEADAELDKVITQVREGENLGIFYLNRGCIRFRRGLTQGARDDFVRARQESPGLALAHYNLGVLEELEGRPQNALTAYRAALAESPHLAQALLNLGNCLVKVNRLEEAAVEYRKLVGYYPWMDAAHVNLAVTLIEMGELDEAVGMLRRVVETRGESAVILNALATIYLFQNDLQNAENYCRRSRQLERTTTATTLLGYVELRRERFQEAVDLFSNALSTDPQNLAAVVGIGTALLERGNVRSGLDRMKSAMSLAERMPGQERWINDLRVNLARAYLDNGSFEEAYALLKEVSNSQGEAIERDVQEVLRRLEAIQ